MEWVAMFSPISISREYGISGETTRDWRRRGFLSGVGQQKPTGRFEYNHRDVVVMVCARYLADCGIELSCAFKVSELLAPKLIAWDGYPGINQFWVAIVGLGGSAEIIEIGNADLGAALEDIGVVTARVVDAVKVSADIATLGLPSRLY